MNERDKELVNQVTWYADVTLTELSRYADLIRADEREACAKIARKVANATRPDDFALDKCYEIENAIRSKGNT